MSTPSNQPYPTQPPAGITPPPVSRPGRVLGIVGFILTFFISILGLILCIVAKVQSRKAGVPNGLATAGIILGIVFVVFQIIGGIVLGVTLGHVVSECASLGPGVHEVGGVTYTCGN